LLARQILLAEQLEEILVQAQEDLYELLPDLTTEDERREATTLVQEMPQALAPYLEPRSRARMLAEQVIRKSQEGAVGIDQKLAGIAAARQRIWQLAESAGDEADDIRWMTRRFDCTERDLRDDTVPWALENATTYQPTLRDRLAQRLWASANPYRAVAVAAPPEGVRMPLDIAKFNSAYSDARYRVDEQHGDIPTEQARLRELIPPDTAPEDAEWANTLIGLLAEPRPPEPEWSALYHEAGRIAEAAYATEGTTEERIAAFARARREIFEIADRADRDEAPSIRAMTRSMEHLEAGLRNPFWEEPAEQAD
jgi:hypothetical protein